MRTFLNIVLHYWVYENWNLMKDLATCHESPNYLVSFTAYSGTKSETTPILDAAP